MSTLLHRCGYAGFVGLALLLPDFGVAQQPPPGVPFAAGFQAGSQQLFLLDLANTPVGEIPAGIKLLQGTLEVVLKDGVPMLKASSASQFLITLPQPLPPDFTLEFEIVPKACCNPADLGIGEVNQGVASAHIEWDSDGQLRAVGGGELYQAPMPEDFRAALPGVLTKVGVSFAGPTVKLYTNGRRLFTLDRQFARKRELRVFLGGINDGTGAVYLAGLRVAMGAPLIAASGAGSQPNPLNPPPSGAPSALTGPSLPVVKQSGNQPSAQQQQTASQSSGMTGTLSSAVTPIVSVTPHATSGAPIVDWTPVVSPGVYSVQRFKLDDASCCNNASPSLTSPTWQDNPPPQAGTYVYQVTLTTNSGAFTGQTQYVYQAPAPAPAPAPGGTTAPPGVQPLPTATAPPSPPAGPIAVQTPIAGQTGLPTRTTQPPPPSSISVIPAGPPPLSTYLTGTPAYVRVNWAMPSLSPRGILYTVERYLESNPACCTVKVSGLVNTGWTDEGTQWAGTYVYRITAVYPDGRAGSIDAKWVRPDPVNPTNFRVASVSAGFVALRWDAVPNASWYELFGPGLPSASFQATGTAFNVGNLAPGTYTWRIGTYYSSPNAPAPVSTAAAAFPQVTVTVP